MVLQEEIGLMLAFGKELVRACVAAGLRPDEDLLAGMRKEELDDVLLVGGGIIPPRDIRSLKGWGVAEVFRPGSSAEDLIEFIRKNVRGAKESTR